MAGFDAILLSYGPLIFGWVAVASYAAMTAIISCFQPHIALSIAVAMAGIPIAVIISAATISVIAATYNPGAFFAAASTAPLSILAFVTETGIEFCIFSVISVFIFVVVQFRKMASSIGKATQFKTP